MHYRLLSFLFLLTLLPLSAGAAFSGISGRAELAYYLPPGEAYHRDIPVPASVIGHEVGEQHVSHDRLVAYMRALAAASNRVSLRVTGKTYEGRELLLLAVSAAENIARLDEIRAVHKARIEGRGSAAGPLVVALAYSVHGNEASGSNASMLMAYHLAASQGEEVRALLEDTVVLIDPSLNPDGLSRFAQWVNSHRGQELVSDPASREHREAWPGGRTNHYWFDLNRDWLPAQHPESRARLAWFHAWRPHVLADFHEMGTNRSYFFQPGAPSRTHPLIPAANAGITEALAAFHARALDEHKSLYYSGEGYDDFYYGKGSTYPDIHGGIGILFEQGSARGHLQDSTYGELGFPFAVRNQFLTSLSTVRGAHALRDRLDASLSRFGSDALAAAKKDRRGGFVFANPGDDTRVSEFLSLLAVHQIEVRRASRDLEIAGRRYPPGDLYVVPLAQPQYRLIRTVFETETRFRDNTFYDVSAWTMPLAFGLPYRSASRREVEQVRPALQGQDAPGRAASVSGDAYAWVVDWRDANAARVIYRAQRAGAQALVATKAFRSAGTDYPAGSVVLPAGLVADGRAGAVRDALNAGMEHRVRVTSVASGLTEQGIDLGSPGMEMIRTPVPALVVGRGVSSYEAGEVWHLLDHRLGIPLSLLDTSQLQSVDLARYTHLLMVDGDYGTLDEKFSRALGDWVKAGGILVAQRRAANWALSVAALFDDEDGEPDESAAADGDEQDESQAPQQKPYGDRDDWEARKVIGGAIFETRLDLTHPLAFGFHSASVPVFHRGTEWVKPSQNPFENVAVYAAEPLMSGFASPENVADMKQSVSVRHTRAGRGGVILFSDIPAFRAFWWGTSRYWLNALFFGSAVDRVSR